MQLVQEKITVAELNKMAEKMFPSIVKAVVDVEKNIMVVDADFHADQEAFLLNHESKQEDLWGIIIHPHNYGQPDLIEFNSMINVRPFWNNKTYYIEDFNTQKKIMHTVYRLVQE